MSMVVVVRVCFSLGEIEHIVTEGASFFMQSAWNGPNYLEDVALYSIHLY
jgi:hypothetical protein